ncbi:MAG: exo-alpha-sialidase [Lentisphaerae bacterium]|nr:exo-alpha-sialidase [Lentisphaerota bacterium]
MSRVELTLREPSIVAVSPPEYGRDPAGRWWGFFQFPDLWRGNDGRLYLAVHVGADSMAGRHEPTQFYASRDGGATWRRVALEETDRTRELVALPDGRQVAFGQERYLYHHAELSPDAGRKYIDLEALGIKPVAGPFGDGYRVNEYVFYRYGDIPAALRQFPMAVRHGPAVPWQETTGTIELPDSYLRALIRAMWWDDKGRPEWREFSPRLNLPAPQDVTALPDGVLLWALATQHSAVPRRYDVVSCLASSDGGRTWRLRGMIADALDTSWGYGAGEQSLARMPNGDLLCVMRTKMSNEAADTHHLATARSTDGGHTWMRQAPLAEFSVTPHLLTLKNGKVALIYGRPGVHVRASADSGVTWSESQPLVGPPERELLARPLAEWWAQRHNFSCANTSVVVTGPDRFLAAYSDFQHMNATGERCKAILAREVTLG